MKKAIKDALERIISEDVIASCDLTRYQPINNAPSMAMLGQFSDRACFSQSQDSDSNKCVTIASPLDWDTEHFGFSAAKLSIIANPLIAPEKICESIKATIEEAYKKFGSIHFSIHVSTQDIRLQNALLSVNFMVYDHKISFLMRARNWKHTKPRTIYPARPIKQRDIEDIRKIIRHTTFPSRFTRDPIFPKAKVIEMHEKWMVRVFKRAEIDRSFKVIEKNKKIISFSLSERIEATGADHFSFFSNALAASYASESGATLSAVAAMTSEALCKAGIIENIVSLTNMPAIRGLQHLGYRSTRAQIALHYTLPM